MNDFGERHKKSQREHEFPKELICLRVHAVQHKHPVKTGRFSARVFSQVFLGHTLFRAEMVSFTVGIECTHLFLYIGFWCMKSFERLLTGASSGHDFARFLCF